MREILTSTPSVVVAITGFVVCLVLVLLDRWAEVKQRDRQQRLREELERITREGDSLYAAERGKGKGRLDGTGSGNSPKAGRTTDLQE